VRFWDSSALVPLLVAEPSSLAASAAFEDDPELLVWWGSTVECVSALARLERENHLDSAGMAGAMRRLAALGDSWREIQPVSRVRNTAGRMLRVHDLRAADALQLAAAVAAAEDQPASLSFVTLDTRLAQAAQREGFVVIQPGMG